MHVQVEYRNSAIINRAALKHKITREDFAKLNEATHLILRIQPDVQNLLLSESIPYAHFTFDNTVLNLMLKGEKSLHEVVELSTENLEHLENYVTRVTNMLRLDYTDQGMKYSLVGAFAEPCFTSIPWPEDIEEQLSKYADLDVVESHPFIEASIPSAVSSSPVPPTPPSEIVNEEEPETVEEPIHVVDEVIVPAPVPVEVVPTAEVEDTEPEYMISEPCPFHGSLGCHCRSSSTFLRGTKIMLYADIGESNTKETFSNSLKNIEENGELFIAAVDTTGDQESYFKDDCYVKGKVSIVTMKNPGLTAFISECGAALSMGASIDDHANLFMEKLVERLDLFKSEAHQLMKLSIKS